MTKAQFIRRRDAINKKRLRYENKLAVLESEYIKEHAELSDGEAFVCDGLQYNTTGQIVLDSAATLLYELDFCGKFSTYRSIEEREATA